MILALLLAASPIADAPPATRYLYLQLIRQARIDGRPRAALAYLDDFDRRYPSDPDAQALRINSLLDLGDLEKAEAATLPPGVPALQGHLLSARGRWAEAIPFYQGAIEANPADPFLRNALGYAQLRAGSPVAAVETLRGAYDLAPSERAIRNNLLLALAAHGQRAEVDAILHQIRDDRERQALGDRLARENRPVIDRQLSAPVRSAAGLSPEEAAVVRQRYLDSIGERPPQPSAARTNVP